MRGVAMERVVVLITVLWTRSSAAKPRGGEPFKSVAESDPPRPLPPTLPESLSLNCTALVPQPIDTHPIRSPQIVHSAITPFLAGRSLVEIGTRNGDGMACFARAAKSAVAVEMDADYCRKLEQRALAIGDGRAAFTVRCDRYQSLALDADVFTWWQQSPHLKNLQVLQHLRRQLDARVVRPEAVAIVLFEVGFPDDMRSFYRLRNLSKWEMSVAFDETALCKRKLRQRWFHARAHGTFRVAEIRIADVPLALDFNLG